MTNQNRMNAGAEYLLYRIWATLQTERGIHAESLLTCVGALAGYACQRYVRDTWPLSRPDDLNAQLIESPLSLWSLVSRSVLKLEEPLPDLQDILRRTAPTAAASELAEVPRLPGWHRPHRPAIVYLKQLWPQALPIVQRFCRRPLQMPVLFGIALQRAIEHTRELLSPTLAASIAMECAIAMARVEVPEWEATRAAPDPLDTSPDEARGAATGRPSHLPRNATAPTASPSIASSSTASSSTASPSTASPPATSPRNAAPGRALVPAAAAKPTGMPALTAITSAIALPSIRATPHRKTTKAVVARQSAPSGPSPIWALAKRIPPAAHIVAIGCLAFISTAGAMYESGRDELTPSPAAAEAAQAPRSLLAMASPSAAEPQSAPEDLPPAETPGESQFPSNNPGNEAETRDQAEESAPPPTLFADSSDVDPPQPPQILPEGYDEGVMHDEWGQTLQ